MMTSEHSPLAREILFYLSENPQAKDTAEGIAQWWLLDQKLTRELSQVSEALAELVEAGLIVMHTGADTQSHYEINPAMLTAIRDQLRARPRR